jgi:hypothetical protein
MTHAENLILHMRRAPGHTIRYADAMRIYSAHYRGQYLRPADADFQRTLREVAKRIARGLYQLKEQFA